MKAINVFQAVLALIFAVPVHAETWASKPVTMVVGYPAGSGIDILARFLAENLRERTGQPFIVQNKAGGFGIVAAQSVARAAPDGHTILFGPASIAVNVHLYKNLTIMRKENGRDLKFKFNYKDVIRQRKLEQNISLKPGDTVIVR